MNPQKKMYKVISPIEKKGGGTYWMRVGSAFTNRDDSINLYLDAVPVPNGKSSRYELQIRELSDEDLRRRESYSASSANTANTANTAGSRNDDNDAGTGYGDLGGIGGGPSSRAVTSGGGSDRVPF